MKSYKALSAKCYRLGLWVVFPIMGLMGCILVMSGALNVVGIKAYTYEVCVPIIAAGIVVIETLVDYWFIPGLYDRTSNPLKAFQLSANGIKVLTQGLVWDIIRRIIVNCFFFGMNLLMGVLIFGNEAPNMTAILGIIEYAVISYTMTTIMIIIARHSRTFLNYFICGYLGAFALVIISGLLFKAKVLTIVIIGVFALVGVVASIYMVELGKKRLKEKYYDEKLK